MPAAPADLRHFVHTDDRHVLQTFVRLTPTSPVNDALITISFTLYPHPATRSHYSLTLPLRAAATLADELQRAIDDLVSNCVDAIEPRYYRVRPLTTLPEALATDPDNPDF